MTEPYPPPSTHLTDCGPCITDGTAHPRNFGRLAINIKLAERPLGTSLSPWSQFIFGIACRRAPLLRNLPLWRDAYAHHLRIHAALEICDIVTARNAEPPAGRPQGLRDEPIFVAECIAGAELPLDWQTRRAFHTACRFAPSLHQLLAWRTAYARDLRAYGTPEVRAALTRINAPQITMPTTAATAHVVIDVHAPCFPF